MSERRTSTAARLFAAVGLMLSVTVAAGADLWDQAVTRFAANSDLVPGRMEITFDQYNGRGRMVSTERTVLEISIGDDGETVSRIVYSERDGEDITEERRENPGGGSPFGGDGEDGSGDGGAFAGLQKSPFDPAEQQAVTYHDTGRRAYLRGVMTHVFEYVHQTSEDSRIAGTAWLSARDGSPLRLEATIEPLPGLVDSFLITQEFASAGEMWYLDSLAFDGEGRILFVKRRIESRMEFADYFRE